MKKQNFFLGTVLTSLLACIWAGCVSTSISSQPNLEVIGRRFNKVLVVGNINDLEYRQLAEEKMCERLEELTDCQCLKSSEVFFPAQKYTANQIALRLKDFQIDAVLILDPESIPEPTYAPRFIPLILGPSKSIPEPILDPTESYTENYATALKNTIIGNSGRTYRWSKPWKYEAFLISTSDNKIAWYSVGESRGTLDKLLGEDITSWNRIISVASRETVNKLVSDGFFRKQSKR